MALVSLATPGSYGQEKPLDVHTQDDVVFGVSRLEDGASIERIMAVHSPVGKGVKERPALVFLHGNPGEAPYPDGRHHHFRDLMNHFAQQGYVCFGVAWDLRQGHAASFGPIEMAVIHIRENAKTYGVNPDRIGVIGGSYGSRHACTLATADFVDPRAEVQACIMMAGGMSYPRDCDEKDAPILLDYGTADPWFGQVPDILKGLQKGNVPHAYFELKDGGHVFPVETPLAFGKTKLQIMEAFLAIHLRHDDTTDLKFLTLVRQGGGRVEAGGTPSYGMYPVGHTVSLTAIPLSGQKFVAWKGDIEDADATVEVRMDSNKKIIAVFEKSSP